MTRNIRSEYYNFTSKWAILSLLIISTMLFATNTQANITTAKPDLTVQQNLLTNNTVVTDMHDKQLVNGEIAITDEAVATQNAWAPVGEFMEIPKANTGVKTWMPYTAITAKSSRQYKLQQNAWTDENGFRRYGNEGYYMIAMGTYYAKSCGQVFRISFSGGKTIMAIIGDIKKDTDTDALNQSKDGNIVEFIIDKATISDICKQMGDMSYAYEDGSFQGPVVVIEKLDELTINNI